MKATELRIGNLIMTDANLEVYKVSHLSIDRGIAICNLEETPINIKRPWKCYPVPLTNYLLEKFGGIKDEEGIFSYIQLCSVRDLRIYLESEGHGIVVTKGMTAPLYKFEHINSVHQLQNFYFAWTGKELIYKP